MQGISRQTPFVFIVLRVYLAYHNLSFKGVASFAGEVFAQLVLRWEPLQTTPAWQYTTSTA